MENKKKLNIEALCKFAEFERNIDGDGNYIKCNCKKKGGYCVATEVKTWYYGADYSIHLEKMESCEYRIVAGRKKDGMHRKNL